MTEKNTTQIRIKAHMMQAMVEAALQGHDIGPWQALDDNNRHLQSVCRRCHQPVLVSNAAAIIMPGRCPG